MGYSAAAPPTARFALLRLGAGAAAVFGVIVLSLVRGDSDTPVLDVVVLTALLAMVGVVTWSVVLTRRKAPSRVEVGGDFVRLVGRQADQRLNATDVMLWRDLDREKRFMVTERVDDPKTGHRVLAEFDDPDVERVRTAFAAAGVEIGFP